MKTYLLLFFEFFKTGLFAVGGGLATLPFLYEMAATYDWFDAHTLTNMVAVSEATPGAIGVNMATYAGIMAKGLLGGIVATSGLVLPSIIIITIISRMLARVKGNPYVEHAFYGLRPVVTGLIAAALFQIVKITLIRLEDWDMSRFTDPTFWSGSLEWKRIAVCAVLMFAVLKWKKSPILYIAVGAAAGLVFAL